MKFIKKALANTNKDVAEELKSLVEDMRKELDELEFQANTILNHEDSTEPRDMMSVTEAYNAMKRPLLDLERLTKEFRKTRGIN